MGLDKKSGGIEWEKASVINTRLLSECEGEENT